VVIKSGFQSLEAASDSEEDLLDRAWGLSTTSRLACQAKIGLADLTIEIPRYTINHAKESH
jgi:2Fe-2S ferredoxin